MEHLDNLSSLIQYLKVGDFEHIHNYINKARELSYSTTERKKLLVLANDYKDINKDLSALLADLAFAEKRPELMFDIEASFESWNSSLKQASLKYLDYLNCEESIELYAKLLVKNKNCINTIPFDITKNNKKLAFKFLKNINDCFSNKELKDSMYSLALEVVSVATVNYINSLKENLIADLIVASTSLSKYRHQNGVNWKFKNLEYLKIRKTSCLLLELSGKIGDENFVSALRSFMRIGDMKIRLYAAIAIIKLNGNVRKSDFIKMAQDPEVRNCLYKSLNELGLLDKFPCTYITAEFFAESDMVKWLIDNSLFACAPEDLELVCIFETEDGIQKYEWYFFKFKTSFNQFSIKGMMTGIAGPYQKNAPLGLNGGNLTTSCFEQFNKKSLQEHIEQMFSVLQSSIN